MQPIIVIIALISSVTLIIAKSKVRVAQVRNILAPIVVIGVYTLYYIGYSQAPLISNEGVIVTMLRAAQFTARIFVLIVDYKGVEVAMQNSVYYWSFVIINILAVILFILSAMSLFARRLYGWMKLVAKFNSESYIFTNANEESLILAKDIRKDKPNAMVVFLRRPTERGDGSLFNVVEAIGGIYIETIDKNPFDVSLLRWHLLRSRSHIFFISDDEERNVADVISLSNSIHKDNLTAAEENIHLYIRFYSNDIRASFEEQARTSCRKIEYTIFSDAELIAYDVVERYAPVDCVNIDLARGAATENYEVMIVGFDRKGRAMLRKMIEFGQFVGSTFKATIVDKTVEQKRGSFAALYPALEENYNLNFVQTHVGEPQFFKLLKDEVLTLKQIVVALGNDSLNIQTAIEIHRMLLQFGREEVQILAVVNSDDTYNYIHTSQELSAINCIGQQSTIFTEENVVKGAASLQARKINEYYRRNNPSKPDWRDLEYIKKESNISVALHAYTKLHLLGLSIDSLAHFASEDEFKAWLLKRSECFENLARTEHLRWNAVYFTRGWQRWLLTEVPANHVNGQDHHLELHCCLVDWDQLPEVDAFIGQEIGTYQSYDFDNIVNLFTLVEQKLIK
ncbi:MAG: hypothetical protein SNH73_07320 [Rikenellaceae bacterium]